MSLRLVHPPTRELPAEYERGNPVICSACGQIWDADDDSSEYREPSDGNVYCVGECFRAYQAKEYRADLESEVLEPLRKLRDRATELADEYGQDDAMACQVLDFACLWVKQEADGKPSTFPDPAVVDLESKRMQAELSYAIWKMAFLVAHGPDANHRYIATLALVQAGRAMQLLENAAALTEGKPAPHQYMHGGAL